MTSPPQDFPASPHDYRYANTSDSMTDSDKGAMKLNLLAISAVDGVANKVRDAAEHPYLFGAKLAGTAAFGAAITRVAYENPRLAKYAIPAMGGMMFLDLASRFGDSWVAAQDTVDNPQNAAKNKAILDDAIGGGLFEYAVYGAAGGFGVKQVASRMDSSSLKERMAALWDDAPAESVPLLSTFWKIPKLKTIHNPDNPDALFYAEHRPSVVKIENDLGNGSGFFVDRNLVATNYHVVRGSVENNTIIDHLGREFTGRMISRDVAADLALIKLTRVPRDVIPQQVSLGMAGPLKRGEPLRAIAHPESSEQAVLSTGKFIEHEPLPFGQKTVADVFANLATRKGSSGGPIFDRNGKVVSLITNGDNDTISGASVEHLSALIRETKAFGSVRRGEWLNVHTTTYPPERGKPFQIDTQVDFRNRIGLADRVHDRSVAAMQREQQAEAIDGWRHFDIETNFGAALRMVGSTSLATAIINRPSNKNEL